MATYTELVPLFSDAGLRNRVGVAILIAANKVMIAGDTGASFSQVAGAHDLRVIWAKGVFGSVEASIDAFWRRMLAANNTASVAVITASTDTSIQTNVDQTVDIMAGVAV